MIVVCQERRAQRKSRFLILSPSDVKLSVVLFLVIDKLLNKSYAVHNDAYLSIIYDLYFFIRMASLC